MGCSHQINQIPELFIAHVLAQGPIAKYYRLGKLQQQEFISHRSESRKSKIKVLTDSVPDESHLLGWHITTFLLHADMTFPRACTWRRSTHASSSCKALLPS